jgi:hypothetical protein
MNTPPRPRRPGLPTGSPPIRNGGSPVAGQQRDSASLGHIANPATSTRGKPATQLQANDAEFVIAQTSDWVRNADTKAGLLFTGLAILLGAVAKDAHELRALWNPELEHSTALWFLASAALLLTVSIGFLIAVLLPRTKSVESTRYAWSWVANASLSEIEQLDPSDLRTEAWCQARALARIAAFKYHYFMLAVVTSTASVACSLIWAVLHP